MTVHCYGNRHFWLADEPTCLCGALRVTPEEEREMRERAEREEFSTDLTDSIPWRE